MLHLRKLLSMSAVVILVMCILASPVSAAVVDNSEMPTGYSSQPVYLDEYSSYTWSSLTAAKAYYGYDFTYTPCSHFNNGRYYNYYYSFSSGSKLYFYVQMNDDDILSNPINESEMK